MLNDTHTQVFKPRIHTKAKAEREAKRRHIQTNEEEKRARETLQRIQHICVYALNSTTPIHTHT